MESNCLKLNLGVFDLHALIQKAFGLVRHLAKDKNIALIAEVEDENLRHVFCFVNGDEGRYLQFLVNFLTNAFKFSNRNSKIKIKLKILEFQRKSKPNLQVAEEGEEYFISFLIIVKDYGMGIPMDKLNTLFLNFTRIEENASVNKDGVGLGLSICKDLIEQMGGSVKVESIPGKSTKFIIQMNTTCNIKYSDLIEIQSLVHEDAPVYELSIQQIEELKQLADEVSIS